MTESWVIVSKETDSAIFETFNRRTAEQVNITKYDVVPIGEYLANFNRQVKDRVYK
jgi:hypothetical protein